MKRGKVKKFPLKRRLRFRTNYRRRKRLLLSRLPRFVVRRTGKNVIVQVVEARLEGDHVLVSAHSRELARDFGWLGDRNNTPAAYLTGLLAGLRCLKAGITKAVLDAGIFKPTKGGRIAAALKGGLDAGLDIPHGEEILPDEDRVCGKHIVDYALKLKEKDSSLYARIFSEYLRRGLPPEKLVDHFYDVKGKILEAFRGAEHVA